MERATRKTDLVLPVEDTALDPDAAVTTLLSNEPSQEDHMATMLEQLEALQRTAVHAGLGRIAADGSFLLGRQIEARRQRETLGSDCTCEKCTPFNQLHWLCFVCGSGPHEWTTRAPRTQRTLMGVAGRAGVRHAVCSDRCGRDYAESLGRIPSGEPPTPTVSVDRLPRAGGDDGFGFMELTT